MSKQVRTNIVESKRSWMKTTPPRPKEVKFNLEKLPSFKFQKDTSPPESVLPLPATSTSLGMEKV